MQQDKKQLVDYLVSLDPSRRTPTMIAAIMNLADEGELVGRRAITQATGYPEKTVRKVLSAYRAWSISNAGADAVASVVARDSGSVVNEQGAEPDGSDWLFNDRYIYNEALDNYVTFISASPKPLVVPGAKHRAMKAAYSNWSGSASTMNEICRTFGMPRNWFNLYRAAHQWTHDSEPFTDEEVMTRPVDEMVADALQMKKLSLHQRYEKEKWADIKRDADKWNRWQATELPKLQEYISAIATKAPPTIDVLPVADSAFAVVISPLNDAHVGKYSNQEVRSPYNKEIARRRVLQATADVIQRVLLFGRPEKWIIPVGSDLTHIDNPFGNTTKGTPQDTDGTFKEIRRAVNSLVIEVFDMLLAVAPIHAVFEEGNHDAAASFETSMFVEAWYRADDRVTIDTAMTPRKYVAYGNPGSETMIAFDHGDRIKPELLVRKMANENRNMWSRCKHHMALVAHLHGLWVSEIDGVMVCRRPSVSGSDRWHDDSGFCGNTPAIAAYLIDAIHGPINQIFAPVE